VKSEDLLALAQAISRGETSAVLARVRAAPTLARAALSAGGTRLDSKRWFLEELRHQLYEGHTLLHVAAAAHDVRVARALLKAGADVRARNRRGAEPLHTACAGIADRAAQRAMVSLLIEAGANPNALDDSGVAPLHRAVRNRSVGAVEALLGRGAKADLPNARGSTPLKLASSTTGKSGSGSREAKVAQAEILELLAARLRR
jgi:hypothetical protein